MYRGHEGVREFLGDLAEAFAELQIVIASIRDLGDQVVADRPRARPWERKVGPRPRPPIGCI